MIRCNAREKRGEERERTDLASFCVETLFFLLRYTDTEIAATRRGGARAREKPRGRLAPLHRTRWRSARRLVERMGVSLASPLRRTRSRSRHITPHEKHPWHPRPFFLDERAEKPTSLSNHGQVRERERNIEQPVLSHDAFHRVLGCSST